MISGNNVSFKIERDRGGKPLTFQYKGTLSGADLKLTITGGRGGTRDVEFKKEK
jgi:hypothetical protein